MLEESIMSDIHQGEFGRFKVIKPVEFGQLIHDWAVGKATPPETIGDLRKVLEGPDPIAMVPDRWKDDDCVRAVQAEPNEFLLRLPPKKMIENTMKVLSSGEEATGRYDVPNFYRVKLRGQTDGQESEPSNDHMTNLDFFLCRVSDYTVSVCR